MQIKLWFTFAFAFVIAVNGGYHHHEPEPETTTEVYVAEESSVQTEIEVASAVGEEVEVGNCDNGLGKCVPFYQCKDKHHGGGDGHHQGGPQNGPGMKWGGPGRWNLHRSQRSPHDGHGHGGYKNGGPKDDACMEHHECCCKIESIDLTAEAPKHFHHN